MPSHRCLVPATVTFAFLTFVCQHYSLLKPSWSLSLVLVSCSRRHIVFIYRLKLKPNNHPCWRAFSSMCVAVCNASITLMKSLKTSFMFYQCLALGSIWHTVLNWNQTKLNHVESNRWELSKGGCHVASCFNFPPPLQLLVVWQHECVLCCWQMNDNSHTCIDMFNLDCLQTMSYHDSMYFNPIHIVWIHHQCFYHLLQRFVLEVEVDSMSLLVHFLHGCCWTT